MAGSATADLVRGREAMRRRAWTEAFTRLAAADRKTTLAPDDLDALALVAHLIGRDADSMDARTRAHHGCFVAQADTSRAVRCAFWLAFGLLLQGGLAQSPATRLS
jgi:hypothetical protein